MLLICFRLIGRSCWMFIRGSEAWFFGAPVLILVLVSPNILTKIYFLLMTRIHCQIGHENKKIRQLGVSFPLKSCTAMDTTLKLRVLRGCYLYYVHRYVRIPRFYRKIRVDILDVTQYFCEPRRIYMLFTGWEVRIVKNCDRGLENAARGRRPRAAFSRPRSQFFTIRTDPKPVNNLFIFF